MNETTRPRRERRTGRPRPIRMLAAATLAATAVLAVGCSSDDDEATTTTEHAGDHADDQAGGSGDEQASDAPAPLEGEPMGEEACGHFATISAAMTGDPSIAAPALEWFTGSLPPALTEPGTTVVDGLRAAFDGDPAAIGSPEFVAAFDEVGSAMWAGCEASSRLDVKGVDYGFEGLPSEIPAGMMALRFENGSSSSEPHELIVLQRPPGDETPLEEIAEMSTDEVMTDFPMTGVVFVDSPDSAATSFMDLPTGRYIAICTIPVGGGETGDPHSAHGMLAEFETV